MSRVGILTGALAIDLLFGEPTSAAHPVVWFGRLIAALEQRAPRGAPLIELGAGLAIALGSGLGAFTKGAAGDKLLAAIASRRAVSCLAWVGEAWLLKTTLSLRTLFGAGRAVQQALERDDLESGRRALRSLVSRETSNLDAGLIAAAAIESLAENASDSIVGPSIAYLAFGLPGAATYRAFNTLDAMIGYRGAYEWLGKVPARIDDLCNLVPARLTAGLIVLASACWGRGSAALRILAHDHAKTASPNAGWPMAATAGALGVELEKLGAYRLGAPARQPTAADIGRAIDLIGLALRIGYLVMLLGLVLRLILRQPALERC